MHALEIVPGLIVDEEMHAAAAQGLLTHALDQPPLTWDTMADPARWWLVPSPDDDQGVPLPYKAELVLAQTQDLTIKVNVWYDSDLRREEGPRPHTHPWEVMEAHVVLGGYRDMHWHRTAAGQLIDKGGRTNKPGKVNRIFARDYHEVTEIHSDPGRTVSVMVCGRWLHDKDRQGIWGHLDLDTGHHVPVQRDPTEQAAFRARMMHINPQH